MIKIVKVVPRRACDWTNVHFAQSAQNRRKRSDYDRGSDHCFPLCTDELIFSLKQLTMPRAIVGLVAD